MSGIQSDNNNLTLAKEYAEKNGDSEENVIQMIRDGVLAGRIKDNIWYVDIELSNTIDTTPDKSSASSNSRSESIDPKLSGIGGWLILPAIGLILGPIIGVIGLFAAIGMYSDVARAGYGDVYAMELIVLLGLLVFTIYAATVFFRKKINTPRIMIALYSVSLTASVLLLGIELSANAEMFAAETGKQLARDIVAAAIWIPYFRVSKRVKTTFVN